MTPTKRALKEIRSLGYTAQVVEHWNSFARRRIDLFGFADIVVLTPGSIVAVQVTAGSSHAARRKKILAEPRALAWIRAGGVLELWSFAKQGARGERKTWKLRKESIVVEDFVP